MLLATPKICILIVYSNCRSFHSKKYKFSTHVSTTWPSFYCHCHNVQVKLELWLMLSAICLAMTKFTMKIHVLTCPPIVSRQIYGIVSRYSKSAERESLLSVSGRTLIVVQSSPSLSLRHALREIGCIIDYEPTNTNRYPFWRSISRDTNMDISALSPVVQ